MSTDLSKTHLFQITAWLIERRTFVVLVFLITLFVGLFCYQTLPLEAFPDVANLQVRVITQVPGKAPEEVERLVTIPIEKELNGIPHSRPPRSISIFGLSVITVVFDDSAEANSARQLILERISNADLPEGVEPELDPNASPVGEIFRYTIDGSEWNSMDKKEVQDWLLNRLFKSVDGIVDSTGFGGPTKTFLVELDPGKLRAFSLSPSQIEKAISHSNDSTGGSYIVNNDQRFMVRGLGLIKSLADLKNLMITSNREGVPVRLKDVAHVEIAPAVRKGQVGLNNEDDVVEGILMMARGDNPSRVINNLKASWDEIQNELPEGLELKPLYDRTNLVKKTVVTISSNVAEGIVLVVVILMLFLFQVRSAAICAVVIPSALLGACIFLKVFNVPANLLSLGAIDFGIIIDGAVIMVEHIAKRVTETDQENLKSVVCSAVSEVAKPILFGTIIIVASFLPVMSFEHVEGRLFKPLAVMMNFNMLSAFFCTFFVVPTLCYLVFSLKRPAKRVSPLAHSMTALFSSVIPFIQKHAKFTVVFVIAFCILLFTLTPNLGCEFIPELEEGNIWLTVTVLPPSVTLEKSVEIAHKLRSIIAKYPETGNVLTQIGSPDDGTDPNPYSMIEVLVELKPQETWRSQFKTKEQLVNSLDIDINHQMPGLVCNFSQCIKDSMEEAMSGVKNGEYAVKIFGKDLHVLERLGTNVALIMGKTPGIFDVAQDQLLGQPQLTVEIDTERAARVGVTSEQVLDVVETAIGGKVVTKVVEDERKFDIVLRLQKSYRDDLKKVGDILVETPAGVKIPLKQLAVINRTEGANSISRENNKRRIAVYANIRGRDLGSTVLDTQRKINEQVDLPTGYKIAYAGEFERAREAGQRLMFTVPLTLVLIFLLIYLSFDSLSLALMAMSCVPITLAISICLMLFTHTSLSVSSGVGILALMGLSVQNSVVVISALKQNLIEKMTMAKGTKLAVLSKLNAIMIAAFVAAAGLLPATFSNGIGAQSQKPFALVIAFGILPVTVLTLLFLPALAAFSRRDEENVSADRTNL